MCIFKRPNTSAVRQDVPEPQKTAEPADIGAQRQKEEQDLYGGTPDLRVDRSTPPSVASSGTGLNLM